MAGPFDAFVVFAEMRTGSNFLEANLNAMEGVTCHGEAFNTFIIGTLKGTEILGISREERDADPMRLVEAIRTAPGLNGFRYFHNHDQRVLLPVLEDPRIAKVVLTRNPLDCFISRRIADATGYWKVTDAKSAQHRAKAVFDAEAFEQHLARVQGFQLQIQKALQVTGQTAYYLDYEDLFELDTLNGLAKFLGVEGLSSLDRTLKKQNPEPMEERVENFGEMQAALAGYDRFDLSRTPNFEPRRGPGVPSWLAAAASPVIHLPIPAGPLAAVRKWLRELDGAPPQKGFTGKELKAWLAAHPERRSFTVLRHPLARAHAAYCDKVAPGGPEGYDDLRRVLAIQFGFQPEADPADMAAHRANFLTFLKFVRSNIAGQTAQRIDPAWASQTAVLQGFSAWAMPGLVLREDELADDLPRLAARLGREAPALGETDPHRQRLAAIADEPLQAAARAAYPRDFELLGFGAWAPPA
ncbi:nodulation protein NodH [Pseudoroseicyclus sp. CXY001]|uniref:nodulation protein NodH n=1 Tax=Pseudoroseicyclus sp. CXY001 TaxID=3242492 RepID=UPI003571531D